MTSYPDCVDCQREVFHDRHRTAAEEAAEVRELEAALYPRRIVSVRPLTDDDRREIEEER